mmetsp:Transcript_24844/g.55974  ORF Transcript_24844/g.55974 Transcript_24844/m.55974 type:complete len:200 (+) Transcript_24844:130-729(+)
MGRHLAALALIPGPLYRHPFLAGCLPVPGYVPSGLPALPGSRWGLRTGIASLQHAASSPRGRSQSGGRWTAWRGRSQTGPRASRGPRCAPSRAGPRPGGATACPRRRPRGAGPPGTRPAGPARTPRHPRRGMGSATRGRGRRRTGRRARGCAPSGAASPAPAPAAARRPRRSQTRGGGGGTPRASRPARTLAAAPGRAT